jgi:alcohol dehydrogenase (cytochrome c)/quinohemoprotein ethanol dehydrogenase
MSFSPVTGLVYIPVHMQEFIFNDEPAFAPTSLSYNIGILRGSQAADPAVRQAAAEATMRSARGRLVAWDPVTQREVWGAEREGPANGGTLSTAGGLVFQGTGTGRFMALDAGNGTELWSSETQTGVVAAPISYEVAGRQHVAIMVGRGGSWSMAGDKASTKGNDLPNISRLLVYSLGGTAALPPAPPPPVRTLAPPPATAPAETVAHGAAVYGTYCSRCHGRADAANFGILPDLRYSPTLATSEAWAAVVLNGQLAQSGMASFAPVISADDADAIRAYIVTQAHAALAAQAAPAQ